MMTEDAILIVCPPPKKGCPKKTLKIFGDEIFFREWNPSRHFFGDLVKSQGSDGPSKLPSRTEEPEEQDEVCRFKDYMCSKNQDTSSISWGGFLKDPRNIRDISMFESPVGRFFSVHFSEAFLIKSLH